MKRTKDSRMVSKMSKGNKKNPYKGTNDKKATVKKQYLDLYYMLPESVGAKSLAEAMVDSAPELAESLECWEEAGVLEIMVGEEGSIDFEMLELSEDEVQDEFLQAHKITEVYLVHTDSTQLGEVKKLVAGLIEKFGGLLCSDSKDFMPIILQ
jgi:hypothetical protein